jgi:hypothetical protein
MRTIQDYLDLALERQKITSDRKLSLKLGLSEGAVSFMRVGKTFPSDDTMIKLAEFAGIDDQVALIELSFMRAAGEAKNTFEKILKRISAFLPATLCGIYCMLPDHAFASNGKVLATIPHPFDPVSAFAIIMYITETKGFSIKIIIVQKQYFNECF